MLPNIDALRYITKTNAEEKEKKLRIEVDKYIDKTVVPLLMSAAAEGKYNVSINVNTIKTDFFTLLTSTLIKSGYTVSNSTNRNGYTELIIEWR